METDNFPNQLKESIEKLGLSLLQFSFIVHMPYATLHAIANGKRKPRKSTAKKICRGFKGKKTLEDLGFN